MRPDHHLLPLAALQRQLLTHQRQADAGARQAEGQRHFVRFDGLVRRQALAREQAVQQHLHVVARRGADPGHGRQFTPAGVQHALAVAPGRDDAVMDGLQHQTAHFDRQLHADVEAAAQQAGRDLFAHVFGSALARLDFQQRQLF